MSSLGSATLHPVRTSRNRLTRLLVGEPPAAPVLPSAARHACGGRGPATRCRAHPQHHARPSPHTPMPSASCRPRKKSPSTPLSWCRASSSRRGGRGRSVPPRYRATGLHIPRPPGLLACRRRSAFGLTSAACARRPPPAGEPGGVASYLSHLVSIEGGSPRSAASRPAPAAPSVLRFASAIHPCAHAASPCTVSALRSPVQGHCVPIPASRRDRDSCQPQSLSSTDIYKTKTPTPPTSLHGSPLPPECAHSLTPVSPGSRAAKSRPGKPGLAAALPEPPSAAGPRRASPFIRRALWRSVGQPVPLLVLPPALNRLPGVT